MCGWTDEGPTDDADETETPRLGDGPSNDLNVVYTVLANRRRRYVLYHLNDLPSGSATVDELVELVAAWEEMTRAEAEIPVDHRAAIETALLTNHLPAIDDAGLVEYDERSGAVKFYGTNGLITRILEAGTIDELP